MKFNNFKRSWFSTYYQLWQKLNLENNFIGCSKTKDFKFSVVVVTDNFNFDYKAFAFKDYVL